MKLNFKFHNIKNLCLKILLDLKKLIRYEANPHAAKTSQQKPQTIPHSIERLFETHTKTSQLKQKHKLPEKVQNPVPVKQTAPPPTTDQNNQNKPTEVKETKKKSSKADKENIPTKSENSEERPKSKMWIRPKSAQTTRPVSAKKRTDPVALYQEYQKDWARFKDNICESSRSDLRWQIREKMSRQN